MESSETNRLAELDRAEHVTKIYRTAGHSMETVEVDWQVDQWDIAEKLKEWQPIAEGFRNMWGAFDDGVLVGFAVYRSHLTETAAQLSLLHVSRGHRGRGIGRVLAERVLEKAETEGRNTIYLTSISTAATVDFYMKLGFSPVEEVNPELFELEPEDIHMTKRLH
jgi:GNAT superfamily N-acetyltransferase